MSTKRDRPGLPMLEKDLLATVRAIADLRGWLCYHTHDSRRSEKGFPDVVLVHVASRQLMFRELKRDDGRVTPDQRKWLDALEAVGADVGVWREADLRSGRIQAELRTGFRRAQIDNKT